MNAFSCADESGRQDRDLRKTSAEADEERKGRRG